MEKLKDSVFSSFSEDDSERVDKYIDLLRDALKSTNSKFNYYTVLLITSILSYHLYVYDHLNDIKLLGFRVNDFDLIQKWFPIVPSLIFLLTTTIGYLRVYQQETIEWLLAKNRPKEYGSDIYRLTFPCSHILGLDILRRQKDISAKFAAVIPALTFVFGSILAPILYISWAYSRAFQKFGTDNNLIMSTVVSSFLIINGIVIIIQSQKI